MKKVAIVGVEGSGKTVMLAALGELYSRPDEHGYYLSPKDFRTASYVAEKISRMRHGAWPSATAEDFMQGLDWTLRKRQAPGERPLDMCEISCLDFAGEVYRKAFVDQAAQVDAGIQSQVERLWEYVERADVLLVLVNLSDIIKHGELDRRAQESMWVTSAILNQALKERAGRRIPQAAIVLSQADCYAQTIRKCGGARSALEKYLPVLANDYCHLDVLEACSVDKTDIDEDGNLVPAKDFETKGVRPIMSWILSSACGVSAEHPESGRKQNDNHRKDGDGAGELTAVGIDAGARIGWLLTFGSLVTSVWLCVTDHFITGCVFFLVAVISWVCCILVETKA